MTLTKRILFWCLLSAVVACPALARQRAFGFCQQGGIAFPQPHYGGPSFLMGSYPGCLVTVYLTGTTTLATLYSDNNNTPASNPFQADSVTGLYFFYADNGHYDVNTSGGQIPTAYTLGDVFLNDLSGLPNGTTELNYTAAGSTAVTRTVYGKLSDVLSVMDFGCHRDGVTDDATCFQHAIDQALSLSNANGIIGGALYFPGGGYVWKSMVNVTKGQAGGLTLYGDGPHATQLQAMTGFSGAAGFNINSNGGAIVFRDMAVLGTAGGLANTDGIYTTGNGQFFSRLWLGGWGSASGGTGSGIHAYECGNCIISDSMAEHNVYGFNFDTPIGGDALNNSETYQNILAGLTINGQIPPGTIGGTGASPPGIVVNTLTMTQDLTGGGGNSAVYVNTNAPVTLASLTINALNNGSPSTGIFADTGTDKLTISALTLTQTMNYAVFALSGWIDIEGGLIDRIGSYPTITVPAGSYSPTTQCAGIYAGSSVSSLLVADVTIRNVAGYGIFSSATNTQLTNNLIDNFGLGNRTGGQQNSTTGLTAIALIPSQTYAVATLTDNQITSSNGSALTAFSYNPTVTLNALAARTSNNSITGVATLFQSNQTAAQLRLQDLDLDGITRIAGGRVIIAGTAAELDVVAPSGLAQFHLTDALEGNFHDFGFYYSPGSYAQIYTIQQGIGAGDPLELEPNSGNGNVLIGGTSDDGSKFQWSGVGSSHGTNFTALGTPANGKLVWCNDCVGGITAGVVNTCAGSGSGAWAFRTSSVWKCPF